MQNKPVEQYVIDLAQYKKIRIIKKGGFGNVFLVEESNTHQQYAAKVNLTQTDSIKDQQLVMREIGILMRVQHPTIINFIGFSFNDFDQNNSITILMDYMPNGSLRSQMEKEKQSIEDDEFATNTTKQKILCGICRGMDHLHSNNIIHRDLNPNNILLDNNFEPKITDFGLSKIFDPNNQNSQSIAGAGTRDYIAPEVIKGNCFNIKADVYSFGIIMYELLSQNEPYTGTERMALFTFNQNIINGKRPIINEHIIKPHHKILIEECIQTEPERRPSFSEIYEKLARDERFLLDDVDEDEFQRYIEDIENGEVVTIEYLRDQVKKLKGEKREIDSIIKSDFFETSCPILPNLSNDLIELGGRYNNNHNMFKAIVNYSDTIHGAECLYKCYSTHTYFFNTKSIQEVNVFLKNEAEILSRINHPCFVRCIGSFTMDLDSESEPSQGKGYVNIYQYFEKNLINEITQNRLSNTEKSMIFAEIVLALKFLNSIGITRCCPEPEYILLTDSNHVKISSLFCYDIFTAISRNITISSNGFNIGHQATHLAGLLLYLFRQTNSLNRLIRILYKQDGALRDLLGDEWDHFFRECIQSEAEVSQIEKIYIFLKKHNFKLTPDSDGELITKHIKKIKLYEEYHPENTHMHFNEGPFPVF